MSKSTTDASLSGDRSHCPMLVGEKSWTSVAVTTDVETQVELDRQANRTTWEIVGSPRFD
jgi:hypothetical protein